MGSSTFTLPVRIDVPKRTIAEAFDDAVKASVLLYGRHGYTGTLAEKDSYTEIKIKALGGLRLPDEMEALGFASEIMNQPFRYGTITDHRGPAGAILYEDDGNKYVLFFGWASS
jgi:hypothetical protein